MTAVSLSRKSFVVLLACTALTTALDQDAAVHIRSDDLSEQTPSGAQRFWHHLARRHAHPSEDSGKGGSAPMGALLETEKLLRTAAMLPAETLKVLRMVTVPLLNTTLALPANVLEDAASMSLGKQHPIHGRAITLNSHLWEALKAGKLLPQHHIVLHKDLFLGPLSLKKILEIGTPKDTATTPSPEVVVPEAAPEPVSVIPGTTPAPVPAVPVTGAPPLPTVEATPPPAVPVTTPPPVAPAPPNVIVVASQPPNESTNQIAIVQNSRAGPIAAVAGISENSAVIV